MKFTVNRKAFAGLLAKAKAIVPSHTTIPILNNLLLTVSDSTLTVTANDHQVGFRGAIPVEAIAGGSITVGGRRMADIVTRLSGETVSIETGSIPELTLKCGRATYQMATLPAIDFPDIIFPADDAGRMTIAAAELARLLGSVAHAMEPNKGRYYLAGVYLSVTDEGLTAVATDAHRLAVATADAEAVTIERDLPSVIIPGDSVTHLIAFAKATDGALTLTLDDVRLAVTGGGGDRLMSQLVEGVYPDWRRLIDQWEFPSAVEIDRADLEGASERLTSLSDGQSRMIRIEIAPDEARALISTPRVAVESSGVEEVAIAEAPGAHRQAIGLNGRYLMAALAAAPEGNITLGYNDGNTPPHLSVAGKPGWRSIIFPIALSKWGG